MPKGLKAKSIPAMRRLCPSAPTASPLLSTKARGQNWIYRQFLFCEGHIAAIQHTRATVQHILGRFVGKAEIPNYLSTL